MEDPPKLPLAPGVLVANLPYSVATPVIANFLISDLPFERLVVTVQWEIAERLMAFERLLEERAGPPRSHRKRLTPCMRLSPEPPPELV